MCQNLSEQKSKIQNCVAIMSAQHLLSLSQSRGEAGIQRPLVWTGKTVGGFEGQEDQRSKSVCSSLIFSLMCSFFKNVKINKKSTSKRRKWNLKITIGKRTVSVPGFQLQIKGEEQENQYAFLCVLKREPLT